MTKLFLAGDGELWVVDPAAGTSRHIKVPELTPGDPPHQIAIRGDRLILWGYDTLALDPRKPARQPETIARDSWIWIPSGHRDRVWVGYLDPDHGRDRPLAAVREISTDGQITVPDAKPPGGAWPEVALESGLLITRPSPNKGSSVVELWDPRTNQIRRRVKWEMLGDTGPAYGDLLASCVDDCRNLLLTDFSDGTRRTIEAPKGLRFEVRNAEFSPDGSTLAITVLSKSHEGHRLAMVSLTDEEVEVIPDSHVPPLDYSFVNWNADGDEVFLAGWSHGLDPILVSHSRGEGRAAQTPIDVGRFYDAAAG